MIGISRRADYGVRAMLCLAEKGSASSREIARAMHIPEKFLPHIFTDLSRAGLVSSSRGNGGGVRLAKRASEITLRNIVEAIEGPIALNQCLLDAKFCCRSANCPVRKVWAKAQKEMVSVLGRTTLEDMARMR